MEYKEKVIRAKRRIEFLRKVHGLRKKDVFKAMGFSKQHYHQKYQESDVLSVKSLIGITNLLGISEYDLLHSLDTEFNELPIVKAFLDYSQAWDTYQSLKLGKWDCEPFNDIAVDWGDPKGDTTIYLFNVGDLVEVKSAMDVSFIGKKARVTKVVSKNPVSYELNIGGGHWLHSCLEPFNPPRIPTKAGVNGNELTK